MAGAAHARMDLGAAPAWAPPRRRRHRPSTTWPGDVALGTFQSPEVADVPAWVDRRERSPVAQLRFAIAAVLTLDISLLLFHLAWG